MKPIKLNPVFEDLQPPTETKETKLPRLKIHYAVKDLEGDVPFIEIESMEQFYDAFMCGGFFDNVKTFEWVKDSFDESMSEDRAWNTVFTASIGNQIFATDNFENAKIFIVNAWRSFYLDCENEKITDVWIMEWESFEEAYKYSLDLKEESPLCYS